MSHPFVRLETERLILRSPQTDDFSGWAAFLADPEATRHLGGPHSDAMAWRHFLMMAGAWNLQGQGTFSLLEKASGRWLGWCGPWHPVGWPGPEVGWCVAREYWGRGYAAEAAAAAIDWAFEQRGWDAVIHLIAPENQASQAVARKLGSTIRERIEMPEPFAGEIVDVWSQTRAQWQARRSTP